MTGLSHRPIFYQPTLPQHNESSWLESGIEGSVVRPRHNKTRQLSGFPMHEEQLCKCGHDVQAHAADSGYCSCGKCSGFTALLVSTSGTAPSAEIAAGSAEAGHSTAQRGTQP